MSIPTDPISAAIYGIDLALTLLAVPDGYARLRNGISARAEAEGRDVTEEEENILDALLTASEKARDGK